MLIKKKQIYNLEDIYSLLGITTKTISNWRKNITSTQSYKNLKRDFIERVGKILELSFTETEELANKAGLTLYIRDSEKNLKTEFSEELFPDIKNIITKEPKSINHMFATHFNNLLSKYKGKKIDLYKSALISERMFRYIKLGKHLRKESILSLLIAMELDLAEIQIALSKAGFILSKSLINDAVIMWILNHKIHNKKGNQRLFIINEILDELELPLLITRAKGEHL